MTATTNMLTLRTGGEYHEAIVITTHMSLEKIRERDAVLFFEAASLARNPKHRLFGDALDDLRRWGLVDPSGKMHDAVRDVVKASVVGGGLELQLLPIGQVVQGRSS